MLKGILSISGQPGLYRLVNEAKNNIIVESLLTGKRMPVYSSSKVSALSDISVFTETGEIQLMDLFIKIKESKTNISTNSSSNELKKNFEEILPDYDKSRVYVSDMKKIIQWYLLLESKELLTRNEDNDKIIKEIELV